MSMALVGSGPGAHVNFVEPLHFVVGICNTFSGMDESMQCNFVRCVHYIVFTRCTLHLIHFNRVLIVVLLVGNYEDDDGAERGTERWTQRKKTCKYHLWLTTKYL